MLTRVKSNINYLLPFLVLNFEFFKNLIILIFKICLTINVPIVSLDQVSLSISDCGLTSIFRLDSGQWD